MVLKLLLTELNKNYFMFLKIINLILIEIFYKPIVNY